MLPTFLGRVCPSILCTVNTINGCWCTSAANVNVPYVCASIWLLLLPLSVRLLLPTCVFCACDMCVPCVCASVLILPCVHSFSYALLLPMSGMYHVFVCIYCYRNHVCMPLGYCCCVCRICIPACTCYWCPNMFLLLPTCVPCVCAMGCASV